MHVPVDDRPGQVLGRGGRLDLHAVGERCRIVDEGTDLIPFVHVSVLVVVDVPLVAPGVMIPLVNGLRVMAMVVVIGLGPGIGHPGGACVVDEDVAFNVGERQAGEDDALPSVVGQIVFDDGAEFSIIEPYPVLGVVLQDTAADRHVVGVPVVRGDAVEVVGEGRPGHAELLAHRPDTQAVIGVERGIHPGQGHPGAIVDLDAVVGVVILSAGDGSVDAAVQVQAIIMVLPRAAVVGQDHPDAGQDPETDFIEVRAIVPEQNRVTGVHQADADVRGGHGVVGDGDVIFRGTADAGGIQAITGHTAYGVHADECVIDAPRVQSVDGACDHIFGHPAIAHLVQIDAVKDIPRHRIVGQVQSTDPL
ncbi:MAG: hypothetical protein A4E30_00246 [Methanomassiliicoccales archaeon PtaB.Bin215]|nr:MAG: hypothetical protein A4E30_00246 [Methanomassiliicoccales archaeon PtaB.Bin215]